MELPELVPALRRGDATAFDALFREVYAGLVAAADRLLADRAAAEDVAQEVMLELWRRREAAPDAGSIRAYLYQATRNRALNHLRHARTVRAGEPHAPRPSPSPAADAEARTGELRAAVDGAVGSLPPDVRETFLMSRVDGLTYGEIAAALEISVKTVEARMGRALRTVREKLAPWLPDGRGW